MKSNLIFAFLFAMFFTAPVFAQNCEPSVIVFNGFSAQLIPTDVDGLPGAEKAQITIPASKFVLRGIDACNTGSLQYRIRKSGTGIGLPAETSITFSCDDPATQSVEVWVVDGNGHTNYAETYTIIQQPVSNGVDCFDNNMPLSAICSNDKVQPTIVVINGFAVNLIPDGRKGGNVFLQARDFVKMQTDNCPGRLQFRIRRSEESTALPPTTTSIKYTCADDLGIHLVEIWAGDANGNWSYTETYFILSDAMQVCGASIPVNCYNDKIPPTALVYNGLSTNILKNGTCTLNARDFLYSAKDNCGTAEPTILVRWSGTTTPPQPTITFTCNELGTQLVEVIARDAAGNENITEGYVLVQDNAYDCPNAAQKAVSNHRHWPESLDATMERLSSGMGVAQRSNMQVETVTESMRIVPNPAADVFTLQPGRAISGKVSVYLYDSFGRRVRTLAENVDAVPASGFQIGDLSAGTYWCRLVTATGGETGKLVKI
ncbi:MAG: T9SS type A sorting domain-containing protein [Bacteroidota bacterium]